MLLTSEVTITSYSIKWQNPIAKIMTLRELKALKSNTALDFRFSTGAQNCAKITGFSHFIEYEVQSSAGFNRLDM